MTKRFASLALAAIVFGVALFGNLGHSQALFHLMRIEGAMAGLYGNTNVQFVELRMASPSQNFVSGHVICFFDASGAPYAMFRFPSNSTTGNDLDSILIGTTDFDTVWPAGGSGAPDFFFNPITTSAIAPAADVDHPVRPSGKISFGSDSNTTPANMCQGGFSLVDSIAYGTTYTGTVNFGTKLNATMTQGTTVGVHLIDPTPCIEFANHTCTGPRNNSADYGILDLNAPNNQPRNNATVQGPLTIDFDGDGLNDSSDNCPAWPNANQLLPTWTIAVDDPDCDGWPGTVTNFGKISENAIQTAPATHCAGTATANDEGLPDATPLDFNDDQLFNSQDTGKFGGQNAAIGHQVSQGPFGIPPNDLPGIRFDWNGDNLINSQDTGKYQGFFGKNCKPIP